jgi:ABC-type glycerol-3-phosphate transport system substrate-binding protein
MWAVASGPQLEALGRLVADLSQPLGAQVVVIGKSADGLVADIRADALAGLPPPDLIWGSQDELGLLQRDEMIQPASDGLAEQALLPGPLAGAVLNGQRWGTPLAAQGYLLLLYNRKLANSAPRTTDELISRARALTAGDKFGMVAAWAEPRWFTAWLNGFGGTALGADGRPTLDTPQTVAALNLLKELRASGPPPPSTYDEGVRLFRQGRAAFAIDGDWSLAGYREYTDTLDLGIAPLPAVPATGQVAAPGLGGVYLMYGRGLTGPRLDQARALGQALATPAAQTRIAAELQLLPALRAALADPAVTSNPALAAAAAQAPGAPGLPPTAALRCAWDAIAAELPPVLLGDQDQASAAAAMQSRADACAQQ